MKPRQGSLLPDTTLVGPSGRLEEDGYARNFTCIAGFDEVGRGPLAGPVVAAAVVLPAEFLVAGIELRAGSELGTRDSKLGINDSKLLTAQKREALEPWIKENAVAWAVGAAGPEEIDRINILEATLLAMARAFAQLRPAPDYLLIDGQYGIPVQFLKAESDAFPTAYSPVQRTIRKGDRISLSIAAASIVAKVARDRMMIEYDRLYPQYGFAQHKGYGNAAHLSALQSYGPCPIHRRSFEPVRKLAVGACRPADQFELLKADT
jgi:ribonuclease HII